MFNIPPADDNIIYKRMMGDFARWKGSGKYRIGDEVLFSNIECALFYRNDPERKFRLAKLKELFTWVERDYILIESMLPSATVKYWQMCCYRVMKLEYSFAAEEVSIFFDKKGFSSVNEELSIVMYDSFINSVMLPCDKFTSYLEGVQKWMGNNSKMLINELGKVEFLDWCDLVSFMKGDKCDVMISSLVRVEREGTISEIMWGISRETHYNLSNLGMFLETGGVEYVIKLIDALTECKAYRVLGLIAIQIPAREKEFPALITIKIKIEKLLLEKGMFYDISWKEEKQAIKSVDEICKRIGRKFMYFTTRVLKGDVGKRLERTLDGNIVFNSARTFREGGKKGDDAIECIQVMPDSRGIEKDKTWDSVALLRCFSLTMDGSVSRATEVGEVRAVIEVDIRDYLLSVMSCLRYRLTDVCEFPCVFWVENVDGVGVKRDLYGSAVVYFSLTFGIVEYDENSVLKSADPLVKYEGEDKVFTKEKEVRLALFITSDVGAGGETKLLDVASGVLPLMIGNKNGCLKFVGFTAGECIFDDYDSAAAHKIF